MCYLILVANGFTTCTLGGWSFIVSCVPTDVSNSTVIYGTTATCSFASSESSIRCTEALAVSMARLLKQTTISSVKCCGCRIGVVAFALLRFMVRLLGTALVCSLTRTFEMNCFRTIGVFGDLAAWACTSSQISCPCFSTMRGMLILRS